MIIVSTDGSCLLQPGRTHRLGVGQPWPRSIGRCRRSQRYQPDRRTTRGCSRPSKLTPGTEPLLIESDSQYAIKCASEWVTTWRRNGWRTSSG